MEKFCRECGKEIKSSYKVCIHCGTPIKTSDDTPYEVISEEEQQVSSESGTDGESPASGADEQESEEVSGTESESPTDEQTSDATKPKKQPMSKKQKLIWRIVAGIAVLLIGFSMWVNNYYSPESVQKRFTAAVTDQDNKKVKKLMLHEDDSAISIHEADAVIALADEQGISAVLQLTTVVHNGKFLGVFDTHKIMAVDQYVYYDTIEGLSFTFNGKEISEHESDEEIVVYGPLSPGIYHVEAMFESDYGEMTMEESVTFNSEVPGHYSWINMDVPIERVVFHVDNYDFVDPSHTYVQFNDEKFPISEYGETEAVGPFVVDGSQQVNVIVEAPWGEVESEPFSVDDMYVIVSAEAITTNQFKDIRTVVEDFGEQYIQTFADKSTKPLTTATAELKDDFKEEFDYYDVFSGQLDTIAVDEQSLSTIYNGTYITGLFVQYGVQADYHEPGKKPKLTEELWTWELNLTYDPDDETWLIIRNDDVWDADSFEPTETWDGAGKLYSPSEKAVAKAKEKPLEDDDLEQFIFDYTEASVDAINDRNFSLMSQYVTKEGPRHDEARDYIDYLDSKDIYEEWYGSELENVEEIDEDIFKVTVTEEFEIIRPDKTDVTTFRTVLIIKYIDNQFYVDELIETNPI